MCCLKPDSGCAAGGIMQVSSGYKTITSIQIANALAAERSGTIDQYGLRTYFACLVLVAIREAAGRQRRKRREKPREEACYRVNELERLTGLSAGRIRRALRKLDQAGLVGFTEGDIHIEREALPGSEELQTLLSCRRSPRRPIPVPRSVLRFMARTGNGCLMKTMLAYVVRGLSLSRQGGEVSSKGTVKASWISTTFAISQRSVKYAQARLQQWEWVSKDTKSVQRKLNRDGAYFVINLEWRSKFRMEKPIVIPHKQPPVFAPPPQENCTSIAPPIENRKTSPRRDQYQNAHEREAEVAGVYEKSKGEEPSLHNIQRHDLFQFLRLEQLYFEAVDRGWVDRSEATALNFIAAAVKAREEGDDPPRLFVAIVRRGLWHHLNQAHEDRARAALNHYRAENSDCFRLRDTDVAEDDGSMAA